MHSLSPLPSPRRSLGCIKHGRSPGLRVDACAAFPGLFGPSGIQRSLAAYSRGGGSGCRPLIGSPIPDSHFGPPCLGTGAGTMHGHLAGIATNGQGHLRRAVAGFRRATSAAPGDATAISCGKPAANRQMQGVFVDSCRLGPRHCSSRINTGSKIAVLTAQTERL
ncbi:hypothetical protein AIOL_000706 [Candidatus Rhodobacter oscarellae]|uniref:Uncharacterized protein n=1 Tax=Candidatus Rhodobacter oscarellae TaxID=1675527 RepID=A0A0J9EFT3_9RHOB|nr:hypothetical protein AIOL_000706 [Candidatus Rhodobacter lobularis]